MPTSFAKRPQFKGTPKFFDVSVNSTPGAEQIIIDETVGPDDICKLLTVFVKSIFPADWRLEIDGGLVASGAAGPGYPKDTHFWIQGKDALANKTIKLKVAVAAGFAVDKISGHIEAVQQ